jgi:hypothetical protein
MNLLRIFAGLITAVLHYKCVSIFMTCPFTKFHMLCPSSQLFTITKQKTKENFCTVFTMLINVLKIIA